MSDWNCRKGRDLFIPGKNPPKTYICEVCGSKIIPSKSHRYTAKGRISTGGINNAITGVFTEPELYDAYDCPVCGCQFIAGKRFEEYRGI